MRIFPSLENINNIYATNHLSTYGSGYAQTDVYNIGSGYGYGFPFGHGYGYGSLGVRGEGNGYLKYPDQLIQNWNEKI